MCFKSRLETLRIRVGLLILYRLHLRSAFSSQCQKTRAVPFSSPLSSLPGEGKLCVAQKHLRWKSLLHYPPTGDKFQHLVSVANPVAHKTPALTASRVKSTFRPPRAWNKICLKEHSMQSDHAMGRQEGVSLLHWTSALVLKEQHLDKTQSCRQGGLFLPQTSLHTTEKSKVSVLPKIQPLFRAVQPFCRNFSN